MKINDKVLTNEEKVIFTLRSLFRKYGYQPFKMSKFEEYDLYARNKDFLISDNIITFTDTNGKLMALKPDVTLSIIKNSTDDAEAVQKLYYDEHVYRVSKGSRSFKEITQVGLECIGNVDDYCIYEVLRIAAECLGAVSEESVLEISHLGVLSDVMNGLDTQDEVKHKILKCISEKNLHELTECCTLSGIHKEDMERLRQLVMIYGTPKETIAELQKVFGKSESVRQLEKVVSYLSDCGLEERVRINFSVVNDMTYYNGIVFKGFVNGIPTGIISGGQYDKLMSKMGRKSKAIGFAVYMDMLELLESASNFDVDVVLLYNENTSIDEIVKSVERISMNGESVMAQRRLPDKIRFRRVIDLTEKNGGECYETNA